MKNLLLLLCLFVTMVTAQAETNHLIFNTEGSTATNTPLTGSGSSVATSAWDIVYRTLPNDTLAAQFNRRVHRHYANDVKGFGLPWSWTESAYLDNVRLRNDTVSNVPIVTQIAALDSLYKNLSTEELRLYLRYKNHYWYMNQKGWKVYARTEAALIERLKTLLGE